MDWKLRGRRQGTGRALTDDQEAQLRRMICEHRSEQLKMAFALWTRPAVMALIERECGVALSIRAVGNYLARWGFTPQQPIKRAYEQSAPAVKAWLESPIQPSPAAPKPKMRRFTGVTRRRL